MQFAPLHGADGHEDLVGVTSCARSGTLVRVWRTTACSYAVLSGSERVDCADQRRDHTWDTKSAHSSYPMGRGRRNRRRAAFSGGKDAVQRLST